MYIPDPIFIDKTTDSHHFNQQIHTDKLAYIAEACNKYLFPTVLFPWGCSNYMHQAGTLKIDLMIQRFLMKCKIKLMSNDKRLCYSFSARDDYLRNYIND